jgi:serine/threonine protein kinase
MSYETGQPIFKDYILKSYIGEGGFGRVYLVESPKGIRFALKVLHRGIEMERRGVESVKGISSDYLVRVLDYGETLTGQPCILMEYYKDNLRGLVDAGNVDEVLACRCFEHILKGLMVLERHGVMHRDIKPENLFIREGNVKIGDFGTARYTAGDTSHKSHVIGTIQYMAPERFSEKYGHAVDRWAAAVVFYRLLTGEYPFKGKDRTQVFAAILRDEPDLDSVPGKYKAFLGKCFTKEEKHRHRSTQEMLTDFKKVGETKPPKLEPKPKPETKARKTEPTPIRRNGGKKKFRSLIVIGLIGILLAGGGYSLWFVSKNAGDNGLSGQTERAKYSLVVNTTPADAVVKLLDAGKNYSPGVQLPPGRYNILVEHNDYKTYREWIEITDQDRDLKIDLEKLPVSVKLRNEPITTEDKDKFALKEVEKDYVDNGDGTISDRATGLMWEKSGSQNYMTYEEAEEYVKELNQKMFEGHNDWRLPTVDELWSLMEKEKQSSGFYIDPIFDVPNVKYYWCWSADKRSSGSAWLVGFDNRRGVWGGQGLFYVRCVRSEQD